MCHEDEEVAIDRGLDGGHFFGYSLAHYYVFGNHSPGRTNVWEEFESNRALWGFDKKVASQTGGSIAAQLFEQGLGSLRGAVGTPDQIRTLMRGYADAGVDQVILVSQSGRNTSSDGNKDGGGDVKAPTSTPVPATPVPTTTRLNPIFFRNNLKRFCKLSSSSTTKTVG